MPKFPHRETEIIAFAQLMVDGLTKMATDFPSPPMSAADLQAKLKEYSTALGATVDSGVASKAQHAAKATVVQDIVEGLRANIKYAEGTAHQAPEKLDGLGWGARRSKTPLQKPGQPLDLTMPEQGVDWVVLKWDPPVTGGITAAYQIQRQQPNADWQDVATAMATEYLLSNQPKGVQLGYRVVARNKAGSGNPSGVVNAVL